MINSESPDAREETVETITRAGASGALLLAGLATTIVIVLWLAFYLLVFLPRGAPS